MKKNLLLIAVIGLSATVCMAQEKKATPAKTQTTMSKSESKEAPNQDDMMKKWMDYMTPGKAHEMLAASNGEWKFECTFWMGPGAEPSKMSGSCVNEMVLGGRYQQSKHTGDFNGMPFEGISTLAIENGTNKYISTWIDNMGTGIMYMEGKWDEKTNSVNMKGKAYDPMTGKENMMREIYTIVSDNKHTLTMYTTPAGGKEYKNMEINFMR